MRRRDPALQIAAVLDLEASRCDAYRDLGCSWASAAYGGSHWELLKVFPRDPTSMCTHIALQVNFAGIVIAHCVSSQGNLREEFPGLLLE